MFYKIYFLFFISVVLCNNAVAQDSAWYLMQAQKKFELSNKEQGIKKLYKLEESILLTLPLFYQKKSSKGKTAFQIAALAYQRKDFVQSLYFFRQAQLLAPFDNKIKENIQEVKRKLTNNPHLTKDDFITTSKILLKLKFISLSWVWILIGMLNLFFWAVLIFIYLKRKLIRKTVIKTALLTCLLFIFCLAGVLLVKNLQKKNIAISKYSALLYQGTGDFYTNPYRASSGEEFKVQTQKNNWIQVKTPTNQFFWIKKQDILLY